MGMDQHNFGSYFSQTMTTPTMMAAGALTPPPADSAPTTTIKMEDLQVPFDTPSPAPSSSHDMMSQASSTPAPTNADGKPAKKRKSWGQVLPEPKTSLPPRKRAKTEDEKEQRRIERVKRNRLAAHNSRERKRHEYEILQAEKDQMEADLKSYKEKMAQMEAELKFYRQKYPGETPETVFDLSTSDATDTICPARTSASFPSPISMDSMDSPRDSSCQPETPASTFEALTPEFDSTQYPAAILCDLQCRSISGTTVGSQQLAAMLAYLTLFNLTLQSTKSLLSWKHFSTLTSSPKALLPQWSSPLSTWLTLMSTSMARPSSDTALAQTLLAFLTALMQSSLTCRVPLAQLMLATRLSQRSSSVETVDERSRKGTSRAGPVGGDALRLRLTNSSRSLQGERRVTTLKKASSLGWENRGCGITRRRNGVLSDSALLCL
jgi:flagellar motility protein MotE (MotC chaperone)